jgi:hypothetical protein
MAAAKKSTTTETNSNISDRLDLARSIKELCTNRDKFIQALEYLKTFDEQKVSEIDMKISAKIQQYEDLKLKCENEYKNNCIQTKQKIDEFDLGACEDIVKGYNKMIVDIDVFTNLKNQVEQNEKKFKLEIENLTKQKEISHNSSIKAIENIFKLKQEAEQAKLSSQVEQQQKEINVLKDTIKMQINELAEQRALTKSVADAGSRSQISQNIGKQ